jgi:hypothetical protein
LFVSVENGYCFLVPSTMIQTPPDFMYPNDVTGFHAPALDPNAMESFSASISVSINAPAEGLNSLSYANKWVDASFNNSGQPPPVPAVEITETTFGDQPAAVARNIPGMLYQQVGFVVASGHRYTVSLFPQPGQVAELDTQANAAWDTVTQSIVFFMPSVARTVVTPESVCPTPDNTTQLHIDYMGGVCALIPAGWEQTDIPNSYEFGPSLGDFAGSPIRASINISFVGPAGGKTPMQAFEPYSVNAVAGSAQETTIHSYPAVVSRYDGPVKARQAIVLANDRLYTINNQPHNDPVMTGGAADVELVWQTVINSIAFFTPFR